MNPDDILAQLRECAANATRALKNPSACSDSHCTHGYRAAVMAARFTELDAVMSNHGRLPKAWSSQFIPAPRDPR